MSDVEVTVEVPSGVVIELILPGPPGDPGTIIHVDTTPPSNPSVGDLWLDTN